ncbi:hypothetical protein A2U01_0102767, partial [Trifolium medium]|nr:hypothetical protein [Trifolium medium]
MLTCSSDLSSGSKTSDSKTSESGITDCSLSSGPVYRRVIIHTL